MADSNSTGRTCGVCGVAYQRFASLNPVRCQKCYKVEWAKANRAKVNAQSRELLRKIRAEDPERLRKLDRNRYKRDWAKRKAAVARHRAVAPMGYHLTNAQTRAKLSGLEFSISATDILVPESCPGCGCKLELGEGRKKKSSLSIDRLDSTLGYTAGNVWVLCYSCNRSKNSATARLMVATLAEMCRRGLVSEDDLACGLGLK